MVSFLLLGLLAAGGGGYAWFKRRQHVRETSPNPDIMRDNSRRASQAGIADITSSVKANNEEEQAIINAMSQTKDPAELKQLAELRKNAEVSKSFLVAANNNFSRLPEMYDKGQYADAVKAIAGAKDLIGKATGMQASREQLLDQMAKNAYSESLVKAHDMSDNRYKAAVAEVALLQVARQKAIQGEVSARSAIKQRLLTGLLKGTAGCLESLGRGAKNIGKGVAAGGQGFVALGSEAKRRMGNTFEDSKAKYDAERPRVKMRVLPRGNAPTGGEQPAAKDEPRAFEIGEDSKKKVS